MTWLRFPRGLRARKWLVLLLLVVVSAIGTVMTARSQRAADEPVDSRRSWAVVLVLASLVGGAVLGIGAAIRVALRDRRVHGVEDMRVASGVPVIGVLSPAGAPPPVLRHLTRDAAAAAGADDELLLSASSGAQP